MSQRKKKRSPLKIFLIILLVIMGLLAAAAVTGYFIFRSFYMKTQIETNPTVISTEAPAGTTASEAETEAPTYETEPVATVESSVEEDIESQVAEASVEAETAEPIDMSGIYQILLIGVDRRDASWNGNSDAMILVTVNYDEKTVTLSSFMRDLGVSIPGYGVRKMNHAFAVGGAPLLMETMALNFGITPNNYAWVDFEGMKSIIDALGGVDMELTPAEASYVGISVNETQTVHLDGEQALTHARDRSSGGSDYTRTQRQRDTLLAIVQKMRSAGLGELTDAANAVLPYIHHNIDQTTLLGLIFDLLEIKDFSFLQQRIPFDGLYHHEGEMLVPDFSQTNERLRRELY